jgi:hypothetical protein
MNFTPVAALQRVRVIERIRRNKWKVEWIDPNPEVARIQVETASAAAPTQSYYMTPKLLR